MIKHVARLREERADSKNICLKQKEPLVMLYYTDKNWCHFIKEIYNNFQIWLDKKLLAQSGNQNFTYPQTLFGHLKLLGEC